MLRYEGFAGRKALVNMETESSMYPCSSGEHCPKRSGKNFEPGRNDHLHHIINGFLVYNCVCERKWWTWEEVNGRDRRYVQFWTRKREQVWKTGRNENLIMDGESKNLFKSNAEQWWLDLGHTWVMSDAHIYKAQKLAVIQDFNPNKTWGYFWNLEEENFTGEACSKQISRFWIISQAFTRFKPTKELPKADFSDSKCQCSYWE